MKLYYTGAWRARFCYTIFVMKKIKIATIQSKVFAEKSDNIKNLIRLAEQVSGADIIVLPEMWNCPYKAPLFPIYAEPEGGETWRAMSALAKARSIYLVGGSIPEVDEEGHVYNTCYIFGRNGEQIGKHRKVHLFDVNFGDNPFHESDTLTGGDSFSTFETEWGKMAADICFDVRFPEGMRMQALAGARIIFLPAAFMVKTGEAHWDMNLRMRAVENQVFFVADAPARDASVGYEAWGHSMVIDPWGSVLTDMGEAEGVAVTEIDLDRIEEVRAELPLMSARRTDVYEL